jgi:hypothetical protein
MSTTNSRMSNIPSETKKIIFPRSDDVVFIVLSLLARLVINNKHQPPREDDCMMPTTPEYIQGTYGWERKGHRTVAPSKKGTCMNRTNHCRAHKNQTTLFYLGRVVLKVLFSTANQKLALEYRVGFVPNSTYFALDFSE